MAAATGTDAQRISLARLVSGLPATVPFVAPEAIERRRGRAFELRLGANESSYEPSPLAVRAAHAALRRAAWYGDPECYELRSRLARELGRPISEILVGSGIDDLLGLAVRCIIDPGDVAVATQGTYPTFAYHVHAYGGLLHAVSYSHELHVQPEALALAAERARARLVYVANPDNPSGTWLDDEVIGELAARLPSDCALLVDEAYHDFVVRGSTAIAEDGDPRIVRFRSFSKGHGLAGLRIGYVVADRRYIQALGKVRVQFGVNRVAQAAATASLDDQAHLNGVVTAVNAERRPLMAAGQRVGWKPIASHTNFVTFEVGTAGFAQAWLAALEARGVFVRTGTEAPFDRCVRVTIGTRSERVQLERILDTVEEHDLNYMTTSRS